MSRISFPFRQIQTGIENEKDSITIINKAEFRKIDLSQEENKGEYDKWKRSIKIQGNKATIQIRGVDNGIFVDYIFEKKEGKWIFIQVVDSST